MPKITLRAARVNAGLTQREAAKKLGINNQTLLKYERDSSRIPFALVEKASKVYGLPITCFFLGKKYENNRI